MTTEPTQPTEVRCPNLCESGRVRSYKSEQALYDRVTCPICTGTVPAHMVPVLIRKWELD